MHSRVGQKSWHPFSLTNLAITGIYLCVAGKTSLMKSPFWLSRNIKTIQYGRVTVRNSYT